MGEVVKFSGLAPVRTSFDSGSAEDIPSRGRPTDRLSCHFSVSLLGRRYFLTLLAGRDLRSVERAAAGEPRTRWPHTLIGAAAVLAFVSTMMMCTLAIAYLVKSLIGVDVLDDHFALHPLFFD